MNINIVLDSDYFCQKFSTIDGMREMDKLFLIIKKKTNIIIIQDQNGRIINKILKRFIEITNEYQDLQLPYLKLFIEELAKGTNEYDFIAKEQFENDIVKFVENLKSKDYPLNIVISDKKFKSEVDSYSLDKTDLIFDVLENYSQEYDITNNEEMLKKNYMKKEDKKPMINFDQYQDFLINTFWCSKKIVIVAKEFYDGFF